MDLWNLKKTTWTQHVQFTKREQRSMLSKMQQLQTELNEVEREVTHVLYLYSSHFDTYIKHVCSTVTVMTHHVIRADVCSLLCTTYWHTDLISFVLSPSAAFGRGLYTLLCVSWKRVDRSVRRVEYKLCWEVFSLVFFLTASWPWTCYWIIAARLKWLRCKWSTLQSNGWVIDVLPKDRRLYVLPSLRTKT